MSDTCDECGAGPIAARGRCKRCYNRWYGLERRRLANPRLRQWEGARPGHKVCRRCEMELPESDFGRRRTGKNGIASLCRPCLRAASREARAADPAARAKERAYEARPDVTERIRTARAARLYDVPATVIGGLREAQQGCCAVCKRKRKLAVDHCHATGKVRGLLCYPCNIALGQVGDNVQLLMDLAAYVTHHAESEPRPS